MPKAGDDALWAGRTAVGAIHVTLALLPSLLDPEWLLQHGGLVVLCAVVFAESGLLVGFFLPGDSLLFFAGLLASSAGGSQLPAIPIVLAAVCVAAVTGDQIGYLFGRRVGPALFDRPRSRLFNPKHVVRARTFFEQHGPRTILLARFVPIVRTFAPIVAGVGSMDYATFVTYNVAGGLAWGTGVTLAGYFLGEVDFVRGHIELVLIGLVALSFVPVTREALEARRRGPDREGQADR